MAADPALRELRRQNALRQHREGRFGDSQSSARRAAARSAQVRSDRASEIARSLLEQHRAKIERVLVDALDNGSRAERLKALDLAVKYGLRGEAAQLNEAKVVGDARSRDELIAAIMEKFRAPTVAGALIRQNLAADGVIEAEIVDAQVVLE